MRIPKLRLHVSGQWVVRVDGKDEYLGTNKESAEKRYRELITQHYGVADTSRSSHLHGPRQTVADLIKQFTDEQLATCDPLYVEARRATLTQVTKSVLLLYSLLPAEEFGPKAYKSTRKHMAAERVVNHRKDKSKPRTYTYINSLCSKLKGIWHWGVSDEIVSQACYDRLLSVPDLTSGELGLRDGKEVQPVSEQLFRQTLDYVSENMSDLLWLLWITAARPNEILTLTPAELAKDNDGDYVYRPKNHKTKKKNKRRAIVFGAEGVAILKKHWPARDTDPFFPDYASPSVVRKAVYRACDRAKLPRWHPYQLRHAAITRISLKHGKEVAQAVAGHSKAVMTERYDHGTVERAKRAAG